MKKILKRNSMNWNERYAARKSPAEMEKIMLRNPGCYWCGKKLTYDEVANGDSVCSDECYEMMHR